MATKRVTGSSYRWNKPSIEVDYEVRFEKVKSEKDTISKKPETTYHVWVGDTLVGKVQSGSVASHRKSGRIITKTSYYTQWGYSLDVKENIWHRELIEYSRERATVALLAKAKEEGVLD